MIGECTDSLRLIAVAFWLLGAFLAIISTRALIRGDRPGNSPLGIAYWRSPRSSCSAWPDSNARPLRNGSEPLHAEAGMTFLDGCLSTSILTALVLNAWLGWWWTDAAAALLVGGFAVKGGIDHWRDPASPRRTRHARTSGHSRPLAPDRSPVDAYLPISDLPLHARPRTLDLADMGPFLRGGAVAGEKCGDHCRRLLHRGTTIDWNRRSSDSAPRVVASCGARDGASR